MGKELPSENASVSTGDDRTHAFTPICAMNQLRIQIQKARDRTRPLLPVSVDRFRGLLSWMPKFLFDRFHMGSLPQFVDKFTDDGDFDA